ncbi:MAG: molybdenum cofactor biosynthesis protein MoaE [Thermoleophilia bacterium]|nr:molybdenum cofactor biosynthesis protein MoaE [Thermoleophilia bacterium]
MTVKVRLFAMLRERAGQSAIDVDVAEGATAAQVTAELGKRHGLTDLLARMPVVMAINRDYADASTVLRDGDELALIPPVSGGAAARLHARVTEETLSADRLSEFVRDPAAGGIVVFQGTTRTVDRLDYEAYMPMAEEKIVEILETVAGRHELIALAAEHRTGAVPVSETSVVIAASAAHRAEAFAGARETLDRIKAEVPIWKREVTERADGESAEWVEGVAPR